MKVDLHNHTRFCCHAEGEMVEYVRAAIDKGIEIFGFAEHSPWMPQEETKMALSYEEVPRYISQVRILQERFTNIKNPLVKILLAMEMDFLPNKPELPRSFCEKYEFDYVIGSIHYIDNWGFDQETQIKPFKERSIREIYEIYFELVKQMVQSGIFDIIGHLDLVKKFGYFPKESWDDIQENVAKTIGESRMVVELNTSGMDKPVKEFYPGTAFLKKLKKNKAPVTLSSDAHSPKQVGRHFKKAISLLKELGYESVVTFEKRKRIFKSIL